MKKLTNEQKIKLGANWANVLLLNRSPSHPDRFLTSGGDYTSLGIYHVISRLVTGKPDKTINNFKSGITAAFKAYFPNGWIKITIGRGMYKGLIFIKYGLIGKICDQYSRTINNDPMYSGFTLKSEHNGYLITKTTTGIAINPPKNSPFAIGTLNTPFNKKRGSLLKITDMLIKHFELQADIVLANQDSIYNRAIYSDKYFNTINR